MQERACTVTLDDHSSTSSGDFDQTSATLTKENESYKTSQRCFPVSFLQISSMPFSELLLIEVCQHCGAQPCAQWLLRLVARRLACVLIAQFVNDC